MERHSQTVHNKVKDFECKICGKAFACKKYLNRHLNTALHKKNMDNM